MFFIVHFIFLLKLFLCKHVEIDDKNISSPMLDKVLLPTIMYLITLVKDCHNHIDGAKLEEECKIADICRHDQVPMCGIDSCGEMRTFIDTCDMHEFNCDSKKDYTQKPVHECWVTCKRGRSFKKPAYGADCDVQNLV